MRLLFVISLAFLFASSFSQTQKIRSDYSNGRIYSQGKVLLCPGYNAHYPCSLSTCRKIGEWVYYYQNGRVKQIENDTEAHRAVNRRVEFTIKRNFSNE